MQQKSNNSSNRKNIVSISKSIGNNRCKNKATTAETAAATITATTAKIGVATNNNNSQLSRIL
jgi:hypothetical protein